MEGGPPPLAQFRMLSAFPELARGSMVRLDQLKGKPTVIHMYTG